MATTNKVKVKGWIGVLMTEDSSFLWPTKCRHVYSETSRRVDLEFVCVFGHDGLSPSRAKRSPHLKPYPWCASPMSD